MTDVRRDVYEATNQRQLPWTNSSLLGAFYFAPGEAEEAAAVDAERAAKLEALAAEAEAYEAASKSGDPKALEVYLQAYPAGIYAPLARQALARDAKPEEKVASLEQKPAARTEAAPEAIATGPAPLSREAVRSIQEELRRAGCNPGRPDGLWGDNSRKALRAFANRAKLDLASLEPVEGLLDSLKKHEGEICPAPPPAAKPAEKPAEKPAAKPAEKPAKASKPEPKAQPKAAAKPKAKPEAPAAKAPEPRKKTVTKTASAPKPKTKSAGACFRFNGQLICE